ncbi:MAG: prolyl oligopeptidase family serine peptidase [Chloroflexi bacterium]|nr:prolyl oligopeptidase family serine peptidase [Chloroflexota bacterium]
MTEKKKIPFGLWPSPISPAMQGAKLRLEDVQFDSDGSLVWLESLSGKSALMVKKGADAARDISAGFKIGGGVGYGGGDFHVRKGQAVFASKGRLYRVGLESGLPHPITPEFGACAAPLISPDGSKILFIHTYEDADCLALVDSAGQNWPVKLASSADFYMHPAWHPGSAQVAWVEWDHPQMPWDGSRLMTARLNGAELADIKQIYGDRDIPVFQPEFSADGRFLAFISNDGEWDTLNSVDLVSGEKRTLVKDASLMEPAWIQGIRLFAWSADSARIFYLKNDQGWRTLWAVEIASGESVQVDFAPYSWIHQISAAPVGERLGMIASSPKIPARVLTLENGQQRIERRSTSEALSPDELPEPRHIEWPAPDGTVVHGLYYPPTSTQFTSDGLPPAIVNIHGGPTSYRMASYNGDAAYFATRGYAYLEVNYRGSSCYGREYMLMLRQRWGLIDTEDAAGAAGALAALELADPQRIVIMGGSSGGYTVLNALIHFPGVFKAGVNLYGVANLFDFLIGTHKFEQHYNDSLVGVLPEAAERFKAWSPVFHAEQIKDPVAVFQGSDDKVVPPEHSEQIVAALRANKVPHIYRLYAGEGHGFRKTENIIDYYESLERFLNQYVLF